MGPLHPSSAHLAHLLQDFLGTSPRVETLGRLQRSRPERELRQALQVMRARVRVRVRVCDPCGVFEIVIIPICRMYVERPSRVNPKSAWRLGCAAW